MSEVHRTGYGALLPPRGELAIRALSTGSTLLAAMLLVVLCASRALVLDPLATGLASAGIIASSLLGGWCFARTVDRSAQIGASLGLPLGFFYLQNHQAALAGMADIGAGSARILATAAVVAAVAAASSLVAMKRSARVAQM